MNNFDEENFKISLEKFNRLLEKTAAALLDSFNKITDIILRMNTGGIVTILAFIGTTYNNWSNNNLGVPFIASIVCFVLGVFSGLIAYVLNYYHYHLLTNKFAAALTLPTETFVQKLLDNSIWGQVSEQKQWIKISMISAWGLRLTLFISGCVYGYNQLEKFSETPRKVKEITPYSEKSLSGFSYAAYKL